MFYILIIDSDSFMAIQLLWILSVRYLLAAIIAVGVKTV
jgi:hypothetical protein